MKDRLGDIVRLNHILDAVIEIQNYTANISFENFCNDSLVYHASIRQLEIIGEASNKLSEKIYQDNPEVPWKNLIGLRNIIVHEYFGIDNLVIWNIITKNLKNLKAQISKIIDSNIK